MADGTLTVLSAFSWLSGAARAHAESLRLFPSYGPALAFDRALALEREVPA